MIKRILTRNAAGWSLPLSKPLLSSRDGDEYEMLINYLNEIRFPYQKRVNQFLFPISVPQENIVEILSHFYDGVAEMVVSIDD